MARVPVEIQVNDRVRIPGAEVALSFARSGGPGGQHVNRTESKVLLRWNVPGSAALGENDRAYLLGRLGPRLTADGDLLLACDTNRDQHRNVEEAIRRLADVVRTALHRPKKRRATKPSRGARERRLGDKRRRSGVKRDRRGGSED